MLTSCKVKEIEVVKTILLSDVWRFPTVSKLGQNGLKSYLKSYLYAKKTNHKRFGDIQWLRGHNFTFFWPPTYLYLDIFNPERGQK